MFDENEYYEEGWLHQDIDTAKAELSNGKTVIVVRAIGLDTIEFGSYDPFLEPCGLPGRYA